MSDKSFYKIIEFIQNRKNNAYRKVNEEMICNKIVNMEIKLLLKQQNI